jgi:hypothetical protein
MNILSERSHTRSGLPEVELELGIAELPELAVEVRKQELGMLAESAHGSHHRNKSHQATYECYPEDIPLV